MPTLIKETFISASPEQIWDAVRDVGAFHIRLVPGFTENTLLEGNERTLILPNGASVLEHIVSVDEETRRMVFAVKQGPMPLVHHNASFQVFPDKEGGSKFVWITDFLPQELQPNIQDQMNRVSEVIKQTLEGAAK